MWNSSFFFFLAFSLGDVEEAYDTSKKFADNPRLELMKVTALLQNFLLQFVLSLV